MPVNPSARDVRIVWVKELRETLRDRRTLGVMLLFPLVVYPLIALLLTEVIAGKQAAQGTRASRVAVVGGDRATRDTVRAVLLSLPPGAQPGMPSPSGAKASDGSGGFDVAAEPDGSSSAAKPPRPATAGSR